MSDIMKYEQNGQYDMTVTDASFEEDGSLCLSLRFGPQGLAPLDRLLTTGYVKLSVYEQEGLPENGILTLYGRSQY
jgi:hypothetical protein